MNPAPTLQVSGLSAPVRDEWLALHQEPVVEPALPIVDAHHHLWDRPGDRYLLDNFLADTRSGHRVEASVYVDCRSMYRQDGPQSLRPVGEVEFACRQAAAASSSQTAVCAAIVGHIDLRDSETVAAALAAMDSAGDGRFRGIRQVSAWDPEDSVQLPMPNRPPGLLLDPGFRDGFATLTAGGYAFDAFMFHTQLGELADLAATFPNASIVLDHCGGPLGIGRFAKDRKTAFAEWRAGLRLVAEHPNISVKLSGLGMRMAGFDFHDQPKPPSSETLAAAWRPYIETCIDLFGVNRCMFASNFSPDKGSCSYLTLWNAFKRITSGASADERRALFGDTARRVYRIEAPSPS